MRRSALLASLALLAPGLAHAVDQRDFEVRNAGQLANLCAAKQADRDATAAVNFCHGFTQAAVDMALTQEREAGKPRSICLPNPAPKRQATLDEFVTWVRAQPDRLPSPPTKAFLNFMTERFPCKGG